MEKIIIDGFELTEEHIEMLLNELKNERVKTTADLERYFKNHWHTKDQASKCHLLVDRYSKKRNFALPFDD